MIKTPNPPRKNNRNNLNNSGNISYVSNQKSSIFPEYIVIGSTIKNIKLAVIDKIKAGKKTDFIKLTFSITTKIIPHSNI